jgi:hypothetical protein
MIITAYLVGDQKSLERLQMLPDAVNAGLVRSITHLAIGLRRTLRQNDLGSRALTRRTGPSTSTTDFRVDQSGGTVTASIRLESQSAGRQGGPAGTTNVRASLQRKQEPFGSPVAAKAVGVRMGNSARDLAETSFLRSALDDMTPVVRDGIDAALAEAISR